MSNDLWSTPPEVFNALDMEFGFGFDVCAEHETAKCADYWTIEDDAL
ncbi:MAG: DNA methylase, partial [Rickettsiales bacterium]|nr:DNA methylase [Rickettsiales bacterium]